MLFKKVPFYRQLDQMDCGPTCIKIVAKYYGKNFKVQYLRELCNIGRSGASIMSISEAAEKIGFRTLGVKITNKILQQVDLPIILHWDQKHYVVLFKIKNRNYLVSDPAKGVITYNEKDFLKYWISGQTEGEPDGIALSILPSPNFYEHHEDHSNKISLTYFRHYLFPYRKLIIQLIIGLLAGSILQLIVPFLTQSIVDIGINTRNLNFIYIILAAQGMLLLGRLSIDFIRSWLLLHISTRVNISLLKDFLIKLMKLPISFFDMKMTGDIMQRMEDQKRIEAFLTGPTLNFMFSVFNLVIFIFVLTWYDWKIVLIFLISSILYILTSVFFLKKRRVLDFKRFDISAKSHSIIVQLISGMQEIKLNNSEQDKRWEWERIQSRLFDFQVKTLTLGQYQQALSFFINEGKNLIITFIVAKSVIDGHLSLGAMLAVQYIIGQLNGPIEQMLGFMQQFQDAKISIERLYEINDMEDEESLGDDLIQEIPNEAGISFNNVTFRYPGSENTPVLDNIDLLFPTGKTTAIVGMSGSGKTTILKLILRFYNPLTGDIKIGNTPIRQISHRPWRDQCGVVMQEGFIFSDTIARNIAVNDERPDKKRLEYAMMVANIKEFVSGMPFGLNTKIGAEGNGISQGQKQRILIARAVYKDPEFIFFDEATNALDANNEKIIMENLENFFQGRTVIIVAHRLSTVKNADKILVLERGIVAEQGTHETLTKLKGKYYELVKNQLELGN